MSAPRPSKQPSRKAPGAIARAKQTPTVGNAVSAIEALHDDMVSEFQVVKGDIATLKSDVATLKSDVTKLLHHFGLVSGATP